MSTGFKLIVTFGVALVVLALVQSMGVFSRLDLTEHQLYTLNEGTEALVDELERPVTLKLYFSREGMAEIIQLNNYAQRVAELIEEIQATNPEKISFEQINPEPFSESEDEAAAYGLEAAPIAPGKTVYFGLVAVPSVVDGENMLAQDQATEVIPFLQPDREAFLEYDVAKMIHAVGNPKKPVIGLFSGLDVKGGFNFMRGDQSPPWMAVQQMESLYDVRDIRAGDKTLPESMDLLVMIQPPVPNDDLLYAIDQFALGGGRVLAFIDPLPNTGRQGPGRSESGTTGAEWNRLFQGWGVELRAGQVVGDLNLALMVNQGQGQQPLRHIAIQNYGKDQIAATPFTHQIGQINMATVGEWLAWSPTSAQPAEIADESDEGSGDTSETNVVNPSELLSSKDQAYYASLDVKVEPLLSTTAKSGLIQASLLGPNEDIRGITRDFRSDGQVRNVAVMLSGVALSAFPDGRPSKPEQSETDAEEADTDEPALTQAHLSQGEINAVLVADTDILTDFLWVRVMGQFRGQSIAQPFADNGDFFLNALEHLSGAQSLMSIRSRGTYSRPFTVVEDLRREAEARFREQELALQKQLKVTEEKLAKLQPQDDASLELTPQQQAALLEFQKERLNIRKSLRDVHLQLNRDIDALGLRVKAINIFFVPLLLFIFAVVFFTLRQKKMERAKVSFMFNQ